MKFVRLSYFWIILLLPLLTWGQVPDSKVKMAEIILVSSPTAGRDRGVVHRDRHAPVTRDRSIKPRSHAPVGRYQHLSRMPIRFEIPDSCMTDQGREPLTEISELIPILDALTQNAV